jgi:hypothetical protein
LNLLADIVAVDGGICAIVRPQSSGEAPRSCRRRMVMGRLRGCRSGRSVGCASKRCIMRG